MSRIVSGLLILLLAGCVGNAAPPIPAYDMAVEQLPDLAVLPLPGKMTACEVASCKVVALAAIADALASTGRFINVTDDIEAAEYVLAVAAAREREALHVAAQIYWFDQRLDMLSFVIPAGQRRTDEAVVAESIAAHLVGAFQERRIFATATLHEKLNSSRYEVELRAAEVIGAFAYAGLQVSHNPVHGASLRYLHRDYENTHADVFVYPIPHHDVAAPARLDEEMAVVKRDLLHLEERGWWRDLKLGEIRRLDAAHLENGRVLALSGEFRTDHDLITTTAHVFVRGDKFVKVRASYPKFTPVREDVEAFILALPETLETPAESAFMARLRSGWREALD